MKYAIIESGGKQYKAVEGSTIVVDRLNLEAGNKVVLNEVLLISDKGKFNIGTPTIEGAKVTTTVVEEFKGPKILVFKYHPRKRYRLKRGHRQWYTKLEIKKISVKKPAKTEEAA